MTVFDRRRTLLIDIVRSAVRKIHYINDKRSGASLSNSFEYTDPRSEHLDSNLLDSSASCLPIYTLAPFKGIAALRRSPLEDGESKQSTGNSSSIHDGNIGRSRGRRK